MSLSAKFGIALVMSYSKTDELSTLTDLVQLSRGLTFAEGEGANQVNLVFHDSRPLADAANETIDINDGSLTNKVGETITMDKFKGIYVKNNSTDSTLKIGGAAANQLGIFATATEKIVLIAGGEFIFLAPTAAGIDCTVNAKLKFEHGGEGADAPDYDLIIVGADTP